jgi:hypothetical protein
MAWVYSQPIRDKRIRKIRLYIERRSHDKQLSDRVAKALSLNDFLRENKWNSAKEIQESIFLDNDHKVPVFNEKQSKVIFRMLNQSGGTSDEAVILDKGVRALLGYMREYMPNIVVNVSDLSYPYVTFLKTLQSNPEIGPIIDIAKETAVQMGTTGIVTANTVAAEAAGPVGVAVVAVPAAIAGLMVVLTHIVEDELGEALLASFLILPFVGPILYKTAISTGKIAFKVSNEYPGLIPFGGKRLSTQKRSNAKWQTKTRRAKSAHL